MPPVQSHRAPGLPGPWLGANVLWLLLEILNFIFEFVCLKCSLQRQWSVCWRLGTPARRRAHLNLPPWDGLLAARSSTSGRLRPCPASPSCPIAGRDSCCPLVPAELRHQKGWSRADVPRMLLGHGMHSRWRPHPGLINSQHIRQVTGPLTHP